MARKAFLHINGHDYELEPRFESDYDPGFQHIEGQVQRLVSGSFASEDFKVLVKPRQPITLRVVSIGMWSAAVYLEAAPGRVGGF